MRGKLNLLIAGSSTLLTLRFGCAKDGNKPSATKINSATAPWADVLQAALTTTDRYGPVPASGTPGRFR